MPPSLLPMTAEILKFQYLTEVITKYKALNAVIAPVLYLVFSTLAFLRIFSYGSCLIESLNYIDVNGIECSVFGFTDTGFHT
jgi:hypothetical protein